MTPEKNTTPQPITRNQRFVNAIFTLCSKSKKEAAQLRRADNASTEYQSWETLVRLGVNLGFETERITFSSIAAAIAKSKATENGTLTLGRALALCYDDGAKNAQAGMRLRRLLACHDAVEVCLVLRSMLALIQSRVSQRLDYARLLTQLRGFDFDNERIKAQWAQDFYSFQQSPTDNTEAK